MTDYYSSQMEEVLARTAEKIRGPVVAIHPEWKTNGVYHDLFFAPLGPLAPDFWGNLIAIMNCDMGAYNELRETLDAARPVSFILEKDFGF